jgi:hypothetical protein
VPPFKTILAATFFCGYLAVQIFLPSLSWLSLSSGRWGWGMYAGRRGLSSISYEIHFPSRPAKVAVEEYGTPVTIIESEGKRIGSIVSTVSRRQFVLPYLCRTHPGAEWVGLRFDAQEVVDKMACRP